MNRRQNRRGQTMKQIRNRTANIILLAALAFGLIGCGQSANIEEELPEEEKPEPRLIYQTKTAEIAAGNEAVLFQQGCEDRGFLALINRKTGENIPPELLEDEDFVNDGRYDIFESALFRVTEKGKREKIRRYRPMAAPTDTAIPSNGGTDGYGGQKRIYFRFPAESLPDAEQREHPLPREQL